MPGPAPAHHGLDFLVVQTAHLPERGTGYALARMDFLSDITEESRFEPSVLYGATDWLTLEMHAHFGREENQSFRYESVAPAARFRLTPVDRPFAAGVSAEYEFAHGQQHEDAIELAGVLSYENGAWIASGNILYDRERKGSGEWGYAAGARYTFRQRHGVGIELVGSLESHGSSQMLLGYYGMLSDVFSINIGVGTGIDRGPDWAAYSAFIWQFR